MPCMTFLQGQEGEVASSSLGHALFARTQLCVETIAHEAVHMATGYMRRKKVSMNLSNECGDREEMLAYLVGKCVRQIVAELYRSGVLS